VPGRSSTLARSSSNTAHSRAATNTAPPSTVGFATFQTKSRATATSCFTSDRSKYITYAELVIDGGLTLGFGADIRDR
jgi:hypothetical protein